MPATSTYTSLDLPGRARAALAAAAGDPLLDGLVGWYAMEASHLGVTGIDAREVDTVLAGADPGIHLHAGYTTAELASAGILRVLARLGRFGAA